MTVPVWKTTDAEFRRKLDELKRKLNLIEGAMSPDGMAAVTAVQSIIAEVKLRGDKALVELTERFDHCKLDPARLRVSDAEIDEAYKRVSPELLAAIRTAKENIRRFQEAILFKAPVPLVSDGVELRMELKPVASVGVYVPGGTAPLCSTVLMNVVPARVAGVTRVIMSTPPTADGSVSPDRLVAAREAGCDEVYRIGGAQAIGAMAFGTETVPRVDMIVGPGNIYVTLAKREVFGHVGIDLLGGPSEVVIVADESARAEWVAADMLSQAEHAPGSAMLVTDSESLAQAVLAELAAQVLLLGRAAAANECLERFSAIVVCRDLDECVALANELAPEHLEVVTSDSDAAADRMRNAGAVFVGPGTPVAVGDYVAGPSHVLPTGGTAKFSSGLSANTFVRTASRIRYDLAALKRVSGALGELTRAEGLDAHEQSVLRRTNEIPAEKDRR